MKRTSSTTSASTGAPNLKPKETMRVIIRLVAPEAGPKCATSTRRRSCTPGFAEEGAPAAVDPQRRARHPSALAESDGLRREGRREVVDAEEAEVLERVERLGLAGAREPGHDDDGGPRVGRPPAAGFAHSS